MTALSIIENTQVVTTRQLTGRPLDEPSACFVKKCHDKPLVFLDSHAGITNACSIQHKTLLLWGFVSKEVAAWRINKSLLRATNAIGLRKR
jgi:hypothetical protein